MDGAFKKKGPLLEYLFVIDPVLQSQTSRAAGGFFSFFGHRMKASCPVQHFVSCLRHLSVRAVPRSPAAVS